MKSLPLGVFSLGQDRSHEQCLAIRISRTLVTGDTSALFTNLQSLGLLAGGTGRDDLSVERVLIIKVAANTYCAINTCQVLF